MIYNHLHSNCTIQEDSLRSPSGKGTMKSITVLLVGFIVFFSVAIFFMQHAFSGSASSAYSRSVRQDHDSLMALISKHNETINGLMLKSMFKSKSSDELVAVVVDKESEIAALRAKVAEQEQDAVSRAAEVKRLSEVISRVSRSPISTTAFPGPSSSVLQMPMTSMEQMCDKRYGNGLLQSWRAARETWCDATAGSPSVAGEVVCYPYTQEHKRIDGRGADVFCEATNIFIDFSKISVKQGADKHNRYFSFGPKSTFSTCKRNGRYGKTRFMNHHSLQMASFMDGQSPPPEGSYSVVDPVTYLLARDEDCENSFHSTADFMNMYLVMNILGLSAQDMQVMIFDSHPDGPYIDLIQKAYSPNHPSPAGIIFPRVANPDPMRCVKTALYDGYRRFVLQAFDLLDVPPPPIPSVVLSLRRRTAQKNVGRVMANENDIINILREGNMINFKVVDTATMSYYEQLKLIRSTNVLVGIHGAGLMFIMFAADEAVLVEIHPSYRQDRHFRHAARVTGKIYMPLRAQERETCHGSSDNIVVPIDEFRSTMDGAIRIARSFDDGLSECGLTCDSSILALDPRLDKHYGDLHLKKGKPMNTMFPC